LSFLLTIFIFFTRRIRFWIISAFITNLIIYLYFLSFLKVLLIKETWTFWSNSYWTYCFSILILVYLISIVYIHLLKIQLFPFKILGSFVMDSLPRIWATSIGTGILEIRISIFVVTFSEAYLLQLKITFYFWFAICLILVILFEGRVLLIHLYGRIIFFVFNVWINVWISMVKFRTLESTFARSLHNRGWFCPSLIPLIFNVGITLFNFF